jgi:hypothetical protein
VIGAKTCIEIVLHGSIQSAADYDHGAGWSTLADQHGFALLMPEQSKQNNLTRSFGVPRRGALLASDVAQPKLGRASPQLEHVQPDQRTDAVTETNAAPPLPGAAGSCSAVNQLPKSVVQ